MKELYNDEEKDLNRRLRQIQFISSDKARVWEKIVDDKRKRSKIQKNRYIFGAVGTIAAMLIFFFGIVSVEEKEHLFVVVDNQEFIYDQAMMKSLKNDNLISSERKGFYKVSADSSNFSSIQICNNFNDKVELTLPDGSTCVLLPDSEVTYSKKYDRRILNLSKGNIFTNVAKSELPFYTTIGEVELKVVGTSFYIEYNRGELQTSLLTGLLRLKYHDREILLEPGEEIEISKSGGLQMKTFNIGHLVKELGLSRSYVNASLDLILQGFTQMYGVNIVWETNDLHDFKLNGTLSKVRGLDESITIFNQLLPEGYALNRQANFLYVRKIK